MATLEGAVKVSQNCCGRKSLDVSAILANPGLFAQAREDMYQMYEREVFDIIVTTKLSGTIFASYLASRLDKGLVIVSCLKPHSGFLTEDIEGKNHSLTVGMPEGLIKNGTRAVIVVDEVTHGRDIKAAIDMIEKQGGSVIKISAFVEDTEENARKKAFRGYPIESRLFTEDF